MNAHRLPDGQLFFLHIPKTAGSAFGQILRNQYDARDVCPAQFLPEFLALPKDERSRYRLVSAHLGSDALAMVDGSPTAITLLRDPIERVLSLYEYQLHFFREFGAEHSNEVLADYQKRTESQVHRGIEAFLESPEEHVRAALANTQARYVGGSNPLGPGVVESEDALLERATSELEGLAFVGIVERMQESLDLFSYRFGVYPQRNVEVNTTPSRRQKTPWPAAILERIAALNRVDIELYRRAIDLFERRHEAMRADLARRFPAAALPSTGVTARAAGGDGQAALLECRLNAHYESCYRERGVPRVKSLNRTLAFGPLGNGWQAWEGSPERGYRWTGPGHESTLDLPLATERSVRISMRIGDIASWEILKSLRLTVNGREIVLRRISLGPRWHWITGHASAAQLASEKPFTRIVLHVSKTLAAPVFRKKTRDTRVLGLAVKWIRIEPLGS